MAQPVPPPMAAPIGMDSPKVNMAPKLPMAVPMAAPLAKPVAPPEAPSAAAPVTAPAAVAWKRPLCKRWQVALRRATA
eukprot:CAMPEP_0114681198 /NCGR_PEP_ID=MMETSP0191-20121206/55108_1 /TAXON_ID=126664 /ORGANISM="Sorites sp." /LENGTH=77 /DNA_ID=CAMNT_0001959181 /DNA_START=340 /DNA_END=573 /DNA_ORIENTATION=-